MRLPIARAGTVILLLLVAGCASMSKRSARDSELLTQAEMLNNNFVTVYDAVTAMRSNWLNVRPNTLTATQGDVIIYYDANRLGGPSELRNINVRDVVYVRHYNSTEATQRFGVGHAQGAILVSSHAD